MYFVKKYLFSFLFQVIILSTYFERVIYIVNKIKESFSNIIIDNPKKSLYANRLFFAVYLYDTQNNTSNKCKDRQTFVFVCIAVFQ